MQRKTIPIFRIRLFLILLAFSVNPLISLGQRTRWEDTFNKDLNKTLFVDCGEVPPFVSREVRSPVLVSADGLYKAYVITQAKHENGQCSNRTQLWVKGPKDASFRVVRELLPHPYELGNGLQMIDWSPQCHFLALRCFLFQYEADGGGFVLWIYDAEKGRFYFPNLNRIFSSTFHKNCQIRLAAILGFLDNEHLVLAIGEDWTDYNYTDVHGPMCTGEQDQLWLLDYRNGQVQRSLSEQHLKTYGHIEP